MLSLGFLHLGDVPCNGHCKEAHTWNSMQWKRSSIQAHWYQDTAPVLHQINAQIIFTGTLQCHCWEFYCLCIHALQAVSRASRPGSYKNLQRALTERSIESKFMREQGKDFAILLEMQHLLSQFVQKLCPRRMSAQFNIDHAWFIFHQLCKRLCRNAQEITSMSYQRLGSWGQIQWGNGVHEERTSPHWQKNLWHF